jgi:hypothetical protein
LIRLYGYEHDLRAAGTLVPDTQASRYEPDNRQITHTTDRRRRSRTNVSREGIDLYINNNKDFIEHNMTFIELLSTNYYLSSNHIYIKNHTNKNVTTYLLITIYITSFAEIYALIIIITAIGMINV